MGTPIMTLDEVCEIMTNWMGQFVESWNANARHWTYEANVGEFTWSVSDDNGTKLIGARLANQGETINIWTGEDVNDNINIEDNIIINDEKVLLDTHSKFIKEFPYPPMYNLFMKLEYRDGSEEAEAIANEFLEKESKDTGIKIDGSLPGVIVKQKFDLNFFELYKAYAIYDRANVCRHGILTSANENDLAFCTYGTGALRTDILIDIDEYLDGEYEIIPLIESEQ